MTTQNIRKIEEFEAFIGILEEGQAGHWVQIARALNVNNETIIEWRKHPRAQEAIRKGIEHALSQMEHSGRKDWRMWETKLKMLDFYKEEKDKGTTNNQFNFFNVSPEKQEQFNKRLEEFLEG